MATSSLEQIVSIAIKLKITVKIITFSALKVFEVLNRRSCKEF